MAEPRIQYVQTKDGVSIAYTTFGEGKPLLLTPGWVSHLELSIAHPMFRAMVEGLAAKGMQQVITYDGRGTGLSDRDVDDVSVEARVRDIEAVADHLSLEQFVLMGWSMSGPEAIVYAAEQLERVSHLVLFGTFARHFGEGREDVVRALLALMKAEWSLGSKTVVEFSSPGLERRIAEEVAQFFRLSASMEVGTRIMEEGMLEVDVREYLPKLTLPTLVIHRRDDNAVHFECGRKMAALISGSRFVSLPGDAHPPFLGDWQSVVGAINEFLGHDQPAAAPLTAQVRTVLFTDIVGHTEMMSRLGDERGRDVLREHERITRETLKEHGGTEVKTMGDGFMASFGSVTKAVECAIAMQRAFTERESDEPLNVRVGINAGEPIEEDGDLFGATVILASRIAAEAEGAEILVADTVRGLCSGKGFLFADRGEFVAKGFEDPVRLFEVSWRETD